MTEPMAINTLVKVRCKGKSQGTMITRVGRHSPPLPPRTYIIIMILIIVMMIVTMITVRVIVTKKALRKENQNTWI